MSDQSAEAGLGRLDDDAEAEEKSSTTEGAAAEGEYDASQGSPGTDHPVGDTFPDEATRYDEEERRRTERAE